MKDMAAVKLFTDLDVTKTDTALVGRSAFLLCICFHILQPFKFENKLTPFVKRNGLVAKCAQVVGNFTQDIDRKGTTAHNYEE